MMSLAFIVFIVHIYMEWRMVNLKFLTTQPFEISYLELEWICVFLKIHMIQNVCRILSSKLGQCVFGMLGPLFLQKEFLQKEWMGSLFSNLWWANEIGSRRIKVSIELMLMLPSIQLRSGMGQEQ